jgi:hypothetical protein
LNSRADGEPDCRPVEPPALLPDRLRRLGLEGVTRIVTHRNRSVMVTLTRRRVLRLHLGYSWAPDEVLLAIVRFLDQRLPRTERRRAERDLLRFPVERHAPSAPAVPRIERPRPGDLALLHRLYELHARLNQDHFDGALGDIPIRLSGRMRTRLGELSVNLSTMRPIEITISRRHIARHPWHEVEHTLLHEMVHQWQAEEGLGVNHGPTFRRKARDVGVLPVAARLLRGVASPGSPTAGTNRDIVGR